jgi:glycosyltransferase involved in cell wall biosynthesis
LGASECGTPGVAPEVAGLSDGEPAGVTSLLVRRAHPTPLAAAIAKPLLDKKRRQQMAASALEWSRRYPWEPAAAAVLAAVRRAVAPRRAVLESRKPVPSSVVHGRAPLDSGVLS